MSLVVLDLVLVLWGFMLPGVWFSFFHNSGYVDPQAMLFRAAANWLGFLFIQLLALLRWKKESWWLAVVAGCRLGDAFTDITVLIFCEKISIFGAILFPAAGLGNLVVGITLIRLYQRLKVNQLNKK